MADAGLARPGEARAWIPTARKLSATGLDAGQLSDGAAEVRRVFEQQRSASPGNSRWDLAEGGTGG